LKSHTTVAVPVWVWVWVLDFTATAWKINWECGDKIF